MKQLTFRKQLITIGLLVVAASALAASAWSYFSARHELDSVVERHAQFLGQFSLTQLSKGDARLWLEVLHTASPNPDITSIQLFDGNDQELAFVKGKFLDEGMRGLREYGIVLTGANGKTARLVFAFDDGYRAMLSKRLPELISFLLFATLLVSVFSYFLLKKYQPIEREHHIIRQALKVLPHDGNRVSPAVSSKSNLHNLSYLLVTLREHIKAIERDRSTLHTSTKVLAYQKTNSESILRSAPFGIMVLDEFGQATFVNQQFLRWYGLSGEQVLGTPPAEWCDRADILAFLNRYRGGVARRAESGDTDFSPPGKPDAYISLTAYPMFSSRNEDHINNTLLVFDDVTSEVMAKRAREEFAAAAAHELKTPLHAIGMHAELLLTEDGEDEESRVESANYINSEVAHISELVRNMLNITRIETGNLAINRKLTKLDDLVDSVLDNIKTTASENQVRIIRDYPIGMEPSYLDKDLLRVAMNNLVSNAIKYNKHGGEVKVSMSESEQSIKLTVSDTGLGISDAEQARIFEKFFRSEDSDIRSISGHGLGLSLVKEIVELHGGVITVESTKGSGTDFVVRLEKITVPLKEVA